MTKTPKVAKCKEGDIIEIRCTDIEQSSSWQDLKEIKKIKLPPVKTIGYFLCETPEYVILISMYSRKVEESEEVTEQGSYIIFPRGMVLSMELIQESELNDFPETN